MAGNKNEPLVSICALSFNHQNYIKFAIESFFNQKYKNIEILALDDGSNDNSLKILNDLSKISPFSMKVISQANSGNIGANFNNLLKLAKGKYITFIALDDALLANAISDKVEVMESDDSIEFVINSQIQTIDENNNYTDSISKMPLDEILNPTAYDIYNLDYEKIHSYFIQGALYKKDLLLKIGAFDEDMLADDIVLRTKTAKYLIENPDKKLVCFHKKDCLYRRHSANISANMVRQAKSVIQYLDRYHKGKKSPKMLKNTYRVILKQHKFKDFFELLKYKRLRNYIPLFPLWFLSLFLSDFIKIFKK